MSTAPVQIKPPNKLNTDEDWAQAIAWLQANQLRLHVPRKGAPWFSSTKPEDNLESSGGSDER